MKTRVKCFIAVILLIAVAVAALNLTAFAVSIKPAVSVVSIPMIAFPKAPDGLTAVAGLNSSDNWQVKLSWKDNSSNEDSFKIFRMTSGITPKVYAVIGTVGANKTAYTDQTVELGKTYYYYVAASNSSGDSKSETLSAAVTDAAPKVPTDLKAAKDSETAPTKVTLTWKDQSANESGFKIYRRDSSGGTSYKLIKTLTADITTYVDTDIAANLEGLYFIYRVSAFNSVDETSSVSNDCSVPFLLKVPTGLSVSVTSTTVDLTWTDNSAKESYYGIYRCTDGSSYKLLAGAGENGVSYHDTDLTPNMTYYYAVAAVYQSDAQLGSKNATITGKTAIATSGSTASGSTSGSSSSAGSSAASSSKTSSAASSAVSSAKSSAASSAKSSAASATKSTASSKASSEQTVTEVSAVSEIESEIVAAVTSASMTSAVESQPGQTEPTLLETMRQNATTVIAILLAAILVILVVLAVRRKSRER